MDRRRGRLEILGEILSICRKGVNKTRIVYGANSNFKLMSEYLKFLLERGMVTERNRIWRTTDRGRKFLNHLHDLKLLMLW
ncbi:MAG: winged helix-turn-helix domain-containing protein [Candidatus Bathyarchaeota archaeon]|nr:winged helix-turn-helix domain-containing protein [Candidatus Bathyarchaeota archaeon]MDH5686281.1 winged helix-turn-helix domain-containing protein [Candidatus Bathyarchaeota archaeon]